MDTFIPIAVIGEKGGIGKSTTAAVIASNLASKDKRVLVVDFDASGALSALCGAENQNSLNILDVLHGNCSAQEAIQKVGRIDIIPANNALSAIETFVDLKQDSLAKAVSSLKAHYDFLIVDTAPAPKTKSIIAVLGAVDYVLLPVLAEPQPTKSLATMVNTVAKVKGKKGLEKTAVLVTRFFPHVNVYKDYLDVISKYCSKMDLHLFETSIRNSCVVPEAQSVGRHLSDYKSKSAVAHDYENVTLELLCWGVK